jgi:heptosyltransferase-2
MEKRQKILIFKLGYTEILDKEQNGRIVSLGDVLRTTPILHNYKNDHVTWITSEEAKPLLTNNPYISRLMTLDLINSLQLESEEFDKIINLEKVPGICALSDKIRARKVRYGFTFDTQTGEAEALDKAYEVLAVSFKPEYKKKNQRTFQDLLFEMLGEKFNGEECLLGYNPKTKEKYDVGLNTQVGKKWPSKAWENTSWDSLEKILLKKGLKVTRQDKQDESVLNNLYSYINWINSSKIIVSNDSLGLHLGLAMKKYTLGLFGPTSGKEIYFYDRGKAILPEKKLDCLPCFEPKCSKYEQSCMSHIYPEQVAKEIISGF